MTVLHKNTNYDSFHLQQERLFSANRRYNGSRPVAQGAGRLSVSSSKSGLTDLLKLSVVLALILSVVVLSFDVGALCSRRAQIGKLSSRIESLNSSNAMLQEDLALAMSHPVLSKANSDDEEKTVITLTIALP